MAGEWIKMRMDLQDDPAVYKLASITKMDRFAVIGRLYSFWAWADKHAVDGRVDGATSHVVDDIARCDGFAEALVSVRWLEIGDDFISIPNHDRHNGESAKERSLKNARQARWRQGKADKASTDVDATTSTHASTREEKRRDNPPTPKGGCARFEDFWSAWPKSERKQDKVKCARKWRSEGLDQQADAILADIAVKRETKKWAEGFVEAPLVYLNGQRWKDGVTPEAGGEQSAGVGVFV